MTRAEIHELIQHIEYKDWRIEVIPFAFLPVTTYPSLASYSDLAKQPCETHVQLLCYMPVRERETGVKSDVCSHFFLSMMYNAEEAIWIIFQHIRKFEDHEARECFYLNGNRVFDPHAVTSTDKDRIAIALLKIKGLKKFPGA